MIQDTSNHQQRLPTLGSLMSRHMLPTMREACFLRSPDRSRRRRCRMGPSSTCHHTGSTEGYDPGQPCHHRSKATAAHLGLVDELAHAAHDARGPLLQVSRPVPQAPVQDGHNQGQARCIHGVGEGCAQKLLHGVPPLGVWVRYAAQQGRHQGFDLWVADHCPHLQGERLSD